MNRSELWTAEGIRQETGYSLAVAFPQWRTEPSHLIEYHEEHARLARELGEENVFGSLYCHESSFVLGIFVRYPHVIEGELAAREIERAVPATYAIT